MVAADAGHLGQNSVRKSYFVLGGSFCICTDEIGKADGMLIDFGDSFRPVVGCVEHYLARMLVHLCLVTLSYSHVSMHSIMSGNEVTPGLM